jgi:hypothetical protein
MSQRDRYAVNAARRTRWAYKNHRTLSLNESLLIDTESTNLEPFTALASNIPLDQLNPPKQTIRDPAKRALAEASEKMDFSHVDKAPEDLLNRVLWETMRPKVPFPSWAVARFADEDED